MSARTPSSTLFRSASVTSVTGGIVPLGGVNPAPKMRSKTLTGSYSGGLGLSGPLCERYFSVVPSPPLTRFEIPTSSDLNFESLPITAAATWSMLGALNVDRKGPLPGGCTTIGAPDRIPTAPE
jgi:hypothetical protein